MRALLLLALLGTAAIAPAEILIYKAPTTVVRDGGGLTIREKLGGYTVIESDTGTFVDVTTQVMPSGQKFYWVNYLSGYDIDIVTGNGKTYTVHTQGWSGYDDDGNTDTYLSYAKGQNVAVLINGQTLSVPKTWKVQWRAVYADNGDMYSEEASGTASLDKKTTATYNFPAPYSLDTAISLLEDTLRGQGYLNAAAKGAPAVRPFLRLSRAKAGTKRPLGLP